MSSASAMQEIVDCTIEVIPQLKFTRDAFQDVGPEVVELVLRDVPLCASEIEVRYVCTLALPKCTFILKKASRQQHCSAAAAAGGSYNLATNRKKVKALLVVCMHPPSYNVRARSVSAASMR